MEKSNTESVNSDITWEALVDEVLKGMPGSLEDRSSILNHRLCRLIGMLPFIAGTEHPFRDGFTNLSLFLLSKHNPVKDVYEHQPQDDKDIMHPLIPFCHFSGGDEKILSRGMHLVAMKLLMEYKKNMDVDLDQNRYNPLNSGQWNYPAIMETLNNCVQEVDCPHMDEILTVEYLPFVPWAIGA